MKSARLLLGLGMLATTAPLLRAQSAELQNTVIDCVQFDMHSSDTDTTMVFTGNVVAVSHQPAADLRPPRGGGPAPKGDPKATIGKMDSFKSFIATGNVHIVQGDREAACGRAEVLPGDDKVVLTGQPVVVDHSINWRWTGDELEMLRGERQIRGKNARFTGPPIKDLGIDKPKAVPAPAPE